MAEQKQHPIELNLSREVAEGIYSNLAIISHSTSEFIVDFARMMPGVPKPEVMSRIIMTPESAKRLLFALQDNIKKFGEQLQAQQQAASNSSRTANFEDFAPKGEA